jgi:hypothetical protein
MKKNKLTILSLITLVIIGLFSSNLFAQNQQDYKMDNIQAEHYITISREQIDADNLPLAKVYAQKAVKANAWSAKAWANYDDIIQRIADNGEVEDFETFIERSEAASMPSAADGGSKFEGC